MSPSETVERMTAAPVYLHVGFAKTGTTWLQTRIFPDNPHITYRHGAELLEDLISADRPLEQAAQAVETLRRQSDRPILISWEILVGDPFTASVKASRKKTISAIQVASRIKETVPDAKIIVTLREQADMIESLYRQYTVETGLKNPSAAVTEDIRIGEYLDYCETIRCYDSLFGPENVWAGLYEDLNSQPKQFLSALWRFMDVPEWQGDDAVYGKRENIGLSATMLPVLKLYNRFLSGMTQKKPAVHAFFVRYLKRLDKLLGGRSSSTHRVTSGLVDLSIFAAGNRQLETERNLGMERYGYALK